MLMKINASWFISMAAFVAVDASIVMFLADVFGYDSKHVAYYFLLVGFVIMVTQGSIVGRLNRRYSEWSLCIVGIALNGVGAIMTAGTNWWQSPWLLGVAAVVAAFGRSLFQPTISALVSHHSDPEQQGLAFGFFQAVGTFGRIVGPIIAGFMYKWHLSSPWFASAAVLWVAAIWLGRLHLKERHAADTSRASA